MKTFKLCESNSDLAHTLHIDFNGAAWEKVRTAFGSLVLINKFSSSIGRCQSGTMENVTGLLFLEVWVSVLT